MSNFKIRAISSDGKILSEGKPLITDSTNKSFYFTTTNKEKIKKLEVRLPDSNYWMDYVDAEVFGSGTVEGLYCFRILYKDGSVSNEYRVYYDITNPYGVFNDENGKYPPGSIIKSNSFYFYGGDSLCGVNCIYVKRPNKNNYVVYKNEERIYQAGTYSFYVIDNAGNMSETYEITLRKKYRQYTAL